VDVGILIAVTEQLDRREQQQQPEDQEHERERRDQDRAERDEQRAHDERGEYSERQHPLLVLGGHRERGHDDHEDEEVVDGEALLDDVAGEVLPSEVPARNESEHDAERDRDADVEHRCHRGFAEANRVGVTRARHEQIDGEQQDDHADRRCPAGEAHVKHTLVLPDRADRYARAWRPSVLSGHSARRRRSGSSDLQKAPAALSTP